MVLRLQRTSLDPCQRDHFARDLQQRKLRPRTLAYELDHDSRDAGSLYLQSLVPKGP